MNLYIAELKYIENDMWKFVPLQYIDNYQSIIWTKRWRKCGDFVLTLPINSIQGIDTYDELIDKLLVLKSDNPNEENEYMFIESYVLSYNADDVECLTIKGRDLVSILERRIIWGQKSYTNETIKYICNELIHSQIIDPTPLSSGDYRKIRGFICGNYDANEIINNIQFTGDNLLEAILSVCGEDYSPQVNTYLNTKFVFTLYKGQNRNDIVFARDFDNLEKYEECEDISDYKNAWLVGGEGEGLERKYVDYTWMAGPVSRWGGGISRREKFVDARDVSSNNGEIDINDYKAMLLQRGLDKRLETWINYESTAEIITRDLIYNEDYLVGDKVIIIDTLRNKHFARITEFIRCEDADGYREYPNFEII